MKHQYWGAGEKDCPREIKAGNGELHTLRCKVCGKDNPQSELCAVDTPDELLDVHAICDQRDALRVERDYLVSRMGTIYLIARGDNPTKAVVEIARLAKEASSAPSAGPHDV